MQNVTLDGSSSVVPEKMFMGCTNLDVVTLSDKILTIGESAFQGSGVRSVNIPSKISTIPNSCFRNATRLESITIPETVKTLDVYAFYGSGLKNVVIPSSIKTISDHLFANCPQIESVTLPESITLIDTYAFAGSALPQLTVPHSVVSIGNGAFDNCSKFKSLSINDGTEELSLGYNATNQGLFYDCPLDNVYIGRNVKYDTSSSVGWSPFYRNTSLRSIEIGDIPSEVFIYEFYGCSGLTSAVVGDAVTKIGDYAFSGCESLEEFEVGASITNIGNEAFSDCSKMTSLRTYTATPPTCGNEALADINKFNCTLYIPYNSTAYYLNASQWQEFFKMEEFDASIVVSYIELNETSKTLKLGDTMQLTVTAYPKGASMGTITWASSSDKVATVDANGLVTAKGIGTATITATEASGKKATCTVSVLSLQLSKTSLQMNVGETYPLTASYSTGSDEPVVTWTSSNSSVASVDATGKVSALANGQAVIKATDAYGLEATCDVNVSVLQLTITPSSVEVQAGSTTKLQAAYNSAIGTVPVLTWTTSDAAVATVDGTGLVKALTVGEATVTARDDKGLSATCMVKVFTSSNRFQIDGATVKAGETIILPVKMFNESSIVSFNCDVELGNGLSVEKDEYGDYNITLADRCDNTHTIVAADYNNKIRIVEYSSKNHPFTGNEGTVFYLPIVVNNDIESGTELTVKISDICLTEAETFEEKTCADISAILTVAPRFTLGDVNNDGKFSATDISLAVEFALGHTPSTGIAEAADVNQDGKVSATDVSIIVSYVLSGKVVEGAPMLAPRVGDANCHENLTYCGSTLNGASRWIKLGLTNAEQYVATQFDVVLPQGVTISDVRMAGDTDHSAAFNVLENGLVRVLAYSPTNANFTGENNFIKILVNGNSDDNLEIVNAAVTNKEEEFALRGISVAANDMTGVDELTTGLRIGVEGQNIVIDAPQATTVVIADITGCFTTVQVEAGRNVYPATQGVYIINNKKIIVR